VAQVSIRTPQRTHTHLALVGLVLGLYASISLRQPLYLISPLTSPGLRTSTVLIPSSSPFIRFHPKKPDHISPRHLCLQAIGSPKPRWPTPQVCAPSKPACWCRVPHARLAGCIIFAWSGLLPFVDPCLLYLAWLESFTLCHPYFSFPFCLKLIALHSSLSPFILAMPPDHHCLLLWLSTTCTHC
jgi:hypothetical protein